MKVESWPVDRPQPYEANARKITHKAVEKVAASLETYGWRQPIVVDGDGVVIVGHTRLYAAQHLGHSHVPVHVAKDLTPAQVRAYRIMDNKAHEATSWDRELLATELAGLGELDFDLSLTGFSERELDRLLADLEPVAPNAGPGGSASGGTAEADGADGGGDAEPAAGSGEGYPADPIGLPPFTVLDARGEAWRARTRAWLDAGLRDVWDEGAADPTLVEVLLRWFAPEAGEVIDPFADVRAHDLIAAATGRRYRAHDTEWPRTADLIFGFPPADFDADSLRRAASRLRPNRFAVLVTECPRDTHAALVDVGLRHHAEAVMIQPHAKVLKSEGEAFDRRRELRRAHVHVLIYLKGEAAKAAKAIGEVAWTKAADPVAPRPSNAAAGAAQAGYAKGRKSSRR